MVLVVGATGQVGTLVVRELVMRGRTVRDLARSSEQAARLNASGAEVVRADLTQPVSLDAAVDGQEAVIATANVVAPSQRGDTHSSVLPVPADLPAAERCASSACRPPCSPSRRQCSLRWHPRRRTSWVQNRLMATTNTHRDSSAVLQQLGVQDLQTVRDVLRSKREAQSRRWRAASSLRRPCVPAR